MFSKATRVARDTLYALRFYYEARPRLFALLLIVFAVQTAIPAARLGLEKAAIDHLVSGAFPTVGWLIAGWLACELANALAEQSSRLLQNTLADLANKRTSAMVAGLLEDVPTLEIYHSTQYHDSLDTLNSLGTRISGAVMGVTHGGLGFLRFVSLALILSTVSPWVPLAVTLALIPHAVLRRRLADAQFRGVVGLAPERRRIDYVHGLLFDPGLAKEVKLFGLSGYLFDQYKALFSSALSKQSALHRRQALSSIAASLLSLAGIAAAVIVTVQRFRAGALSAGSVVMAVGAVQSMSSYSSNIVSFLGRAWENSAYMSRLRELVSEASGRSAGRARIQLDTPIETIEAVNLRFAYPGSDRPVLDGVSFALRKGETVALVGANGAGKTTLAKLLLCLYKPTGGSILINGRESGAYDLGSVRSRMACLFQDFVKYLLTVRENVAFGRESEPAEEEIVRAIEEAGAARPVDAAGGLDAQLGKQFGGTDLSQGEWQRLALARAMIRDSDFLVLDEPSSALDADAEYTLYTRFKSLSRDRITILISHRFTTVGIADRILVLSGGRVIEEGSHTDLLGRDGAYARMYRLQSERYAEGGGAK